MVKQYEGVGLFKLGSLWVLGFSAKKIFGFRALQIQILRFRVPGLKVFGFGILQSSEFLGLEFFRFGVLKFRVSTMFYHGQDLRFQV